MGSKELKKIIRTVKLKKLSFDGREFILEFANGLFVMVTGDMDTGGFEIETNIDRERKHREWLQHMKNEKEKRLNVEQKQIEILSKFPESQWPEIRKTFNW